MHDLAYADIVFDGWKAPSIMQVPGARDVAVEFFTMSKSYNMAGWRIGFMVGNSDLVNALARIKSYHDYGTFTPIQVASIVALEGPQDCVEEIRNNVPEAPRRDGEGPARHRLDGREPQGLDVRVGEDPGALRGASGSLEFTKRLIEEAKIAVSPGIGFGDYGDDHVRIALIENEHRLRQARARHPGDVPQGWAPAEEPLEAHTGRPARHRHGRRRHLGSPQPQRRRDPPPRRARHPHHAGCRQGRFSSKEQYPRGKRKVVADAFAVVRSPDIDIVVELIGGTRVAKDLVLEAIANGKHVVTANKALLAKHGNEIFAAAQKKGVMVAFEAAVAGGIPIIKALREGLSGEPHRVDRRHHQRHLATSSSRRCATRGCSFDAVLAEAQARGYAEADPTFDIEGIDAAHKLTILSALAFGIPMQFDRDAYTEGIRKLTRADIGYARGARLPHQAAGHRAAGGQGHRAAGASDAGAGAAAHRQRRRRHERRSW